jgi:hypothetical protein
MHIMNRQGWNGSDDLLQQKAFFWSEDRMNNNADSAAQAKNNDSWAGEKFADNDGKTIKDRSEYVRVRVKSSEILRATLVPVICPYHHFLLGRNTRQSENQSELTEPMHCFGLYDFDKAYDSFNEAVIMFDRQRVAGIWEDLYKVNGTEWARLFGWYSTD